MLNLTLKIITIFTSLSHVLSQSEGQGIFKQDNIWYFGYNGKSRCHEMCILHMYRWVSTCTKDLIFNHSRWISTYMHMYMCSYLQFISKKDLFTNFLFRSFEHCNYIISNYLNTRVVFYSIYLEIMVDLMVNVAI